MNKNSIEILTVGDIAPGDCSIPGFGIKSISDKYGCDYLFSNIKKELENKDLLLGNLEGSLSQFSREKELRLCGLPEMAHTLRNIGFDVLSVANNHVLDHGPEIFKETISHCQQAGLMICGLRGNAEYYSQPVIIEKKGLKVGILAYNWVSSESVDTAGEYIAQVYDGTVNYSWIRNSNIEARNSTEIKNKNVIDDIRKIRNHVDVVILMPHWGYEWIIYPPYGLTIEARSFIDAGADLIVGSHPHVPQGIDAYNNKLIIYSLGDFLFDSATRMYNHGMMIRCRLSPGAINYYSLLFVERDNNYRPRIASLETTIKYYKSVQKSSTACIKPDAKIFLNDDKIYKQYERIYNTLRLLKILKLCLMMLHRPFIIRIVGKKIFDLMKVIFMRIQGKKVRW